MLANFFQFGDIPPNHLIGSYDYRLVILSFIMASFASYVALDIAGHIRNIHNTFFKTISWLIGGAFAMGIGIWSMHFIGMLAFSIPHMKMHYNSLWTGTSMVIAILASGFAFFILKEKVIHISRYILGGIILGLAIASMHYTGMEAMKIDMSLRYIPSLFLLSILVAIIASEAALWLAIKSNQVELNRRFHLKMISALFMGTAICGMHYIGMFSTVFTAHHDMPAIHQQVIDPEILSVIIAGLVFIILGIAIAVSSYQQSLNQQALELAHRGGMAEIAKTILHNIGNVLNSINVSVDLLHQQVNRSKLAGLVKIRELLQENKENLTEFLVNDPKGSLIPEYISTLANSWEKEHAEFLNEFKSLQLNVRHVRDILATQENLSRLPSFEQIASAEAIVEEALQIVNFKTQQDEIRVKKSYEKLKPILIDKVKLLQILVNLLTNAKEALIHSQSSHKLLDINIKFHEQGKDRLVIEFLDNGIGISPENLALIFSQGFTTKPTGHGFGLHSSILAAREMGGEIKASSPGLGAGALFRVELPYKLPV